MSSSLSAFPEPTEGAGTRPRYELADILRLHGEEYRARHPLPLHVHRVLHAIENCRTAALGGHEEVCEGCGVIRISYNSCRDRHCPKCQGLERVRWVEARKRELLPVPYFHTVFTLPHEFNSWVAWNEGLIYDLLFRTVAETLQEFAARHWGGWLGLTSVLHTWGQSLEQHIHLHCIVPGCALEFDGEGVKRCPRRTWLFPVRALSRVFRGKYLEELARLDQKGALQAPPGQDFASLREAVREQEWVVYAKPPFAGPETVVEYLGRYSHRVAISNRRILGMEEGTVAFQWKDYRDEGKKKVMRLSAEEFLRRFIHHILPPRFVRIRHHGLLACGHRAERLNRARALLELPPVAAVERIPYDQLLQELTGQDIHRCPHCGGRLRVFREFLPRRFPSRHDPPLLSRAA